MIFRYPGGKSKKSVREKIFSRFPQQYSEFRDALVGGGGIFFAIPVDKKRWINDLDQDLISVYISLKERPAEFIQQCQEIAASSKDEPLTSARPGGKNLYNARLKEHFDKFAEGGDGVDRALRYLFVHRTVWAGRVNYEIASRMYFSNPNGWNVVFTDKMQKAADCIKNTTVTCGDYRELLFAEGKDVLIYLDPPYCVNTELATNSKLYKHNFEKKDHAEMFDLVKQCKHKVVISYDNHPYVRSLYKGENFNLGKGLGVKYSRGVQWTYCGTSSVVSDGQSATKNIGKELIITNF
jgi:DNA adenine methylase